MARLLNAHESVLTTADFLPADVELRAGQFIETGRTTMKAGVGLALGYGELMGQDNAQGRAYADFRDDQNKELPATVRIELINPQDRVIGILWEGRTESLRASNSQDRRQHIPLPAVKHVATQDWAIRMTVMPDADAKLSAANTTMRFSATKFDFTRS